MRNFIGQFWRDESGFVLVGDWAFVATILVLGAVTGVIVMNLPAPDEPEGSPPAAAHIAR